ncbi:MAG TPA: hypothetical protein VJ739_06015, partial [Gemmataceae bacterium]|nr:hypothetical protein [Gemmataceae bacterium]
AHVREVSLRGTADLAFWKEWLRKEGLAPAESGGQALVWVIAADATFWGVRFRELSFPVVVAPAQEGPRQDAVYLLRAFNSSRLFAWCERAFFATPYYPGDVRVSASLPVSVHLAEGSDVAFRAEMGGDNAGASREPSRAGEDTWEGAVFLPGGRGGRDGQGNLFFARLGGHGRAYPFLTSQDSLTIRPSRGASILQALLDSHFVAREWVVREEARHAKSKTYRRAEALPGGIQLPAAAPDGGGRTA